MRHRSLGVLLALLPLSGCCSLARLFCGPDDSKWVSVQFDTPELTVKTFFEAIRRDAPDVIAMCLAESFKTRNKLDAMAFQVAWQHFRDQHTGLHLVGYAEVPPPTVRTAQEAKFVVEVHSTRIELDLACESFWELTYRRANGSQGDVRRPLGSWSAVAKVEAVVGSDPPKSRLVIEPPPFQHDGTAVVPLETIERAGLVRLWRIVDLRVQPAQ